MSEFVCSDGVQYLRENPGSFDAIFSTDVDRTSYRRQPSPSSWSPRSPALRPNGLLCCRTPNAANLTGTYSRYMDLTHVRSFTDSSLRQLFDVGGFEDCRLVPIRSGGLVGTIRSSLEYLVHRSVFLLCGRGLERTFSYNLTMAGYRREEGENSRPTNPGRCRRRRESVCQRVRGHEFFSLLRSHTGTRLARRRRNESWRSRNVADACAAFDRPPAIPV